MSDFFLKHMIKDDIDYLLSIYLEDEIKIIYAESSVLGIIDLLRKKPRDTVLGGCSRLSET